jgi:hypothetical protein
LGLGLGVFELGDGLIDAAEQRIQATDDPFLLRQRRDGDLDPIKIFFCQAWQSGAFVQRFEIETQTKVMEELSVIAFAS